MGNLHDADTYAESLPHDYYRSLRENAPIRWHDEPGGPGFWTVSRHADATAVLRDTVTYSSARGVTLETLPEPLLASVRHSMMLSDPPQHTLLRKLVASMFVPKAIAALEERVVAHLEELLLPRRTGGTFDFAEELAGRLPLRVISSLLGVPVQDQERLFALTQRMFAHAGASAEVQRTRLEVSAQLKSYARTLGRSRREAPADDIVSVLVHTEVDGQRLSDDQFEALFMLLFNAGAETTRSLLCHLLQTVCSDSSLEHALRAHPHELPEAIEECARLQPSVIQVRRTATRDTTLGEQEVRASDKVVVLLASANRDDTVFVDADSFDRRRSPNPHLTFGIGPHFCLGTHIARMQVRLVMQALLRSFPRIECGAIRHQRSTFVRPVLSFPVSVWS